jgi:hypothetical protein
LLEQMRCKATDIKLIIKMLEKHFVQVIDNGGNENELPMRVCVLKRHATSKNTSS